MDKTLFLKAYKKNWGLSGPGEWDTVSWSVYTDGTYEIRIDYIADADPSYCKEKSGTMKKDRFAKLYNAIDQDWKPDTFSCACDSVAWKFEQYSPDGTIVRSSGELGYIYGKEVLELIASLLPGRIFVRDNMARRDYDAR